MYESLFPRSAEQSKSTAFASFFPPKGEDWDTPFQWIAERTSEGRASWGFQQEIHQKKYPYTKVPKLQNYLNYTFIRLWTLHQTSPGVYFIYSKDNSNICFNSGLQDIYGNDLLLVFSRYNTSDDAQPHTDWVFSFCTTPKNDKYLDIFGSIIPEIAWYTHDSRDYVFDVKYSLESELHGHMFDRAKERAGLLNAPNEFVQNFLSGMISSLNPKIRRNYKIAIPMYYVQEQKMQILLPFYSVSATMALLVERDDDRQQYKIKTILDEDHAFFAARLIALPDADWLNP